jgi:hypothetical protein
LNALHTTQDTINGSTIVLNGGNVSVKGLTESGLKFAERQNVGTNHFLKMRLMNYGKKEGERVVFVSVKGANFGEFTDKENLLRKRREIMSKIKVGDKFQIKSKIYKFNGKFRKLVVTRILDTGFDFTDVEDFDKKHRSDEFMGFDGLEIYRGFGEVVGL